MFNRKFSSNIRRRKRMITSSIILLVVFLSVGYSVFSTNLGISGTLDVSKYDQTLYGVLEKAAKKGTYAKEYTGNHQDSMAGVGTEKIYHWYGSNNANGTAILDMNNVIFANQCWQMIRTTDTGGVKMVYNGEPENNQCLNTRGNHVGYASRTTQSMSTTYYYGTSYTYDSTNSVFSLDGTITTGTIQTGKYTCRKTTNTGTCATLYLIDTLYSGTIYYVIPLNSNSHYSQFGKLQFNHIDNSPSYVGYAYNKVYPIEYKSNTFYINSDTLTSITNYNYSDTIDYNNVTPNEYTLINPVSVSTVTDYTTLLGKYLLINTNTHSSFVYYVVGVDTNRNYFYIKKLSNGDLNTSLTIGDSYTKSGNTYILTNPANVTYVDWYSNTSDYSIYKGKYACDGNNTSCTNLKHIYTGSNPFKDRFSYVDTNNMYSYSESVNYNNGIYTLTGDIKTFWDYIDSTNKGYLLTHHYTCLEEGTSCSMVGYINSIIDTTMCYARLSEVENSSNALYNMLTANDVNQTNSTIKTGIDAWYEKYMTSYTSKLEDTIFCNDRSISDLGAWNPNGGGLISSPLQFKNYHSNSNSDLSCTNETDRFSTNNSKAQLAYPTGLLTFPELFIQNNSNIRKTGQSYWIGSPNYHYGTPARGTPVDSGGGTTVYPVSNSYGVRPVISLKPGTEYTSGNGSMVSPYIVE